MVATRTELLLKLVTATSRYSPSPPFCQCFWTATQYSLFCQSRLVTAGLGPVLKLFSHPRRIFRRRRAECRNSLQGFAHFEPLSQFSALNRHIFHLRMSESCESDLSHQSGNDSDDKGSVASSHASEVPDPLGSRKRIRPQTQISGQAWVYYGFITADAALLHAESDDPEEGPFPRLKSMLLAHWTSVKN